MSEKASRPEGFDVLSGGAGTGEAMEADGAGLTRQDYAQLYRQELAARLEAEAQLENLRQGEDPLPREMRGGGDAEEQLRSAALFPDQNPNPVLRISAGGVVLYANRASRPLLTLWRCNMREAVPEDIARMVQAVLEAGSVRELDVTCDQQVFSLSLTPIPERAYLNIYGRDVTERVRIEQALRDSEREFRAIFELAGSGKALADPATSRFLRVNRRFCQITGYSAEELTRMSVSQLTHPDDCQRDAEALARVMRGEDDTWFIEKRYIRKDGQTAWVHVTGTLMRDATGRPTRTIATVHDVTDRKRAEAERDRLLRELELGTARLQAVLEQMPAGVIIAEAPSGKILLGNRQIERIFGHPLLPSSDVGEYRQWEGFHPDGRRYEAHEWPMARTVRDGEVVSGEEIRVRRADGTERVIAAHSAPVRDRQGNVVAGVVVDHDITDLKLAEEEAKAANRAKDDFLAMLSHELRTPLNAILGWIQLARMGVLSEPEKDEALAKIEQSAKVQAQLVEDILDVSRIINGKLRVEMLPLNLGEVLTVALDAVRPSVSEKGLELEVHAETQAATAVMGDARRLQQVIWNLLNNAAKFTPAGGRVEVRLERAAGGMQLTVSDTGKGISADFLPYVFDRFRQADSSSMRQHGGLGLGLAIVRHIVELHGGTISAHSDGVGRGARFTVLLPPLAVRIGKGELDGSTADDGGGRSVVGMAVAAAAEAATSLEGIRVLVVDDDPNARDLLSRLLARCGAQVKLAGSAAEAHQAMHEDLPDVLVSDIAMPEADGYVLIRQVRELEKRLGRRLPALALTAYASIDDEIRAVASGYDMHIGKPADPLRLARAIASLAKRR